MTTLDSLPPELLQAILVHVDVRTRLTIRRVSRRILRATTSSFTRNTSDAVHMHELLYGERKLSECDVLRSLAVEQLVKHAAHNVRHLSFASTSTASESSSSSSFPPWFASSRESLELRQLTHKHELTAVMLHSISTHCTALTTLDLSGHIFGSLDVWRGLQTLPLTLTRLIVDRCRLDVNNSADGEAAEHVLKRALSRLRNLRELSMRGRGSSLGHLNIRSSTLDHLPHSIETLDVSAGQSAKIDALDFVVTLPRLTALAVERSSIDERDLALLAEHCPALTSLNIAHARCLRDFGGITQLRQLSTLVLDGNRQNLSGENFVDICAALSMLEHLSIENCASLTSMALCSIGRLGRLRTLNVTNLTHFGDAVLSTVIHNCVHLCTLHMGYCRRVTVSALDELRMARELRVLTVDGVTSFDQMVLDGMRACVPLAVLNARSCPKCHVDDENSMLRIVQ